MGLKRTVLPSRNDGYTPRLARRRMVSLDIPSSPANSLALSGRPLYVRNFSMSPPSDAADPSLPRLLFAGCGALIARQVFRCPVRYSNRSISSWIFSNVTRYKEGGTVIRPSRHQCPVSEYHGATVCQQRCERQARLTLDSRNKSPISIGSGPGVASCDNIASGFPAWHDPTLTVLSFCFRRTSQKQINREISNSAWVVHSQRLAEKMTNFFERLTQAGCDHSRGS